MCHIDRNLRRDGETNPLGRSGFGEDGGVDADELALRVHERAARVARIDGGIGLDEALDVGDAQLAAPGCADDPHGDGLTDPEGIADRQRQVAHAQAPGVADRCGGQTLRIGLEHGEVGLRIDADERELERAPVCKHGADAIGVLHDMAIG